MGVLDEKIKFENLLIGEQIDPLTVAYHGSTFSGRLNMESDIDVVLIVRSITPELFRKMNSIVGKVDVKVGISLVSLREAGTIFGGAKYYDALHRSICKEKGIPLAYYKILSLNEQFKKFAIDLNFKKCTNIAKIITKTINNYLNIDLGLDARNFDNLITSLEKNLDYFYENEKIGGGYKEEVRVTR